MTQCISGSVRAQSWGLHVIRRSFWPARLERPGLKSKPTYNEEMETGLTESPEAEQGHLLIGMHEDLA